VRLARDATYVRAKGGRNSSKDKTSSALAKWVDLPAQLSFRPTSSADWKKRFCAAALRSLEMINNERNRDARFEGCEPVGPRGQYQSRQSIQAALGS
jgi:hypothetical protein